MDAVPLDILTCPFCRGDLVEKGSSLVCPEGFHFSMLGGIIDLYMPRCRCGGVFRPVSENQGIVLSCEMCHDTVEAKDRMKDEQSPEERELYVPREKTSVESEWDEAAKHYWTLPLAASKSVREEIFDNVQDEIVLDMGAGLGLWLHYLQDVLDASSRMVAVDISRPMLEKAREGIMDPARLCDSLEFSISLPQIVGSDDLLSRIIFVRADAERSPFKDNVFDSCISFQALQYTNQRTSISQLLRVTKPGGRLVIGTQPGSEACGYLVYDCDISRVQKPKLREGLRKQFEVFDRFVEWFKNEYPGESRLFHEGWTTSPKHPVDLFLDKEKGRISEEEFLSGIKDWREKTQRPLDPTKHSCCYGEKRFTKMVKDISTTRKSKVLEAGIKTIPLEEAHQLDPEKSKNINLEDSWDYGMYLHFYGVRYAVIQKEE